MVLWTFLILNFAHGREIRDIPQIGPHDRILTLDKNENPQNLLAVYTKVKHDCTIANDGSSPAFGFYWLMDGERYKRVHPLIRRGIAHRLEVVKETDPNTFTISFNDLKELDTDIGENSIVVRSHKDHGECTVEARLRLGPSDHGREIRLTGIHTEARRTIFPPFRKLVSVTLSGVDVENGEPLKRTYSGASVRKNR